MCTTSSRHLFPTCPAAPGHLLERAGMVSASFSSRQFPSPDPFYQPNCRHFICIPQRRDVHCPNTRFALIKALENRYSKHKNVCTIFGASNSSHYFHLHPDRPPRRHHHLNDHDFVSTVDQQLCHLIERAPPPQLEMIR